MDKIDKNKDLEKFRDNMQPLAKKIMDKIRKENILKTDNDNFPTMELELTHEQRESKKPVGKKGYYRMYRWECEECDKVGKKMPYSEMQTDAIKHYEKTGHKMKEHGGVFSKGDLYT